MTSSEAGHPTRRTAQELIGRSIITIEQLLHERNHHHLTGLVNNVWLQTNLPKIIAEQPGEVGVLAMDLDNLKAINDRYGHGAGSEYLQRTALKLRETTKDDPDHPDRAGDIAVHISGDEFAIVAPGIRTQENLDALKRRAEASLHAAGISASIDGVIHSPGETAEELLARADEKMLIWKALKKFDNLTFRQGEAVLDIYKIARESDIDPRDLPSILQAMARLAAEQETQQAGLSNEPKTGPAVSEQI